MRPRRFSQYGKSLVVYAVLLGLIIAAALLSDTFLRYRNIENLLRQSAALGLISIGQTFTILTAGIDLSVGSVVSLTSCLTSGIIDGDNANILTAMLLVFGLALLIGFVNGFIITKTGVHPLIVTLGMMSVVQGGLLLYTKEPTGSIPESMDFIAWGKFLGIPFPPFILFAVGLICIILLKKTVFGALCLCHGRRRECSTAVGH